jgi:hypothetical protein
MAVLGVARPQSGWPAVVFYRFGYLTPYARCMHLTYRSCQRSFLDGFAFGTLDRFAATFFAKEVAAVAVVFGTSRLGTTKGKGEGVGFPHHSLY